MQRRAFVIASIALLAGTGCAEFTGHDRIRVNGTVHYYTIEMGFWAVRGDDSVTYDPMKGLPVAFQQEGLRVHLVAKPRPDLAGFQMVGPLVEIVSITRL